jgi:hypothetical protein
MHRVLVRLMQLDPAAAPRLPTRRPSKSLAPRLLPTGTLEVLARRAAYCLAMSRVLTLHLKLEPTLQGGTTGSLAWVLRSGGSTTDAVEYPSREEAEVDALAVIGLAAARGEAAELFIHYADGATTHFKVGAVNAPRSQ